MWLVMHQGGVELIRDESMLHPVVRARFRERRRKRPLWWVSNGIAVGLVAGLIMPIHAQGTSDWTSPSTIQAAVTMIFAFGMMWQARNEDRRRIEKLENESATKETVNTIVESVNRIESKIDRAIIGRDK